MLLSKNLVGVSGRALRTFADPARPVLAQLVVTLRCNLACSYCDEYDMTSPQPSLGELLERIDRLADMGTLVVTLTGGEPLLNPALDALVARVVERGMVCTMVTNGRLLTLPWIERLNDAGLTLAQLSIDTLDVTPVSEKSLTKAAPTLALLRKHARFSVNVNAVLGACPADELEQLVRAVRGLGFYMTVSPLHGAEGISSSVVNEESVALWDRVAGLRRRSLFHRFGEGWEREMLREGRSPWRCRAGARYLYVGPDGLAYRCSRLRDRPGVALADCTREQRLAMRKSPCPWASRCTLGCARRASSLDNWRASDPAQTFELVS